QVANLRRSLITRPSQRRVHALARRNRKLLHFVKRDLAVTLGVGICHIRKARAKALVIRPCQRILPLKIDVVAQDDQRALSILDINAARGVSENQSAYASSTKHARRKSNLGRRIAFVQMHSSLHHGNGNVAARSSQLTDHELSGMT